MKRQIIMIDQDKCNGCGACAAACHESAIGMVNGKATLLRDDYCDGLGNCLPVCPTGAITFIEREAAAYDEAAVKRNQAAQKLAQAAPKNTAANQAPEEKVAPSPAQAPALPARPAFVCPGSRARMLKHQQDAQTGSGVQHPAATSAPAAAAVTSRLSQWPVQIKLAPVRAPYFDGAKLLIAADCTAYARADFHERFIKNHITLIGCPKLDAVDYTEKLAAILTENEIKSVTVVRMEVPCCGGMEMAVKAALQQSGKMLPWQVVTLSVDGEILDD
ncbi:MAG: 4Fe-4S binding protein [Acidaminococcaceae bacterium]|jgi:ferredoxin/phosphohistidine swiveling domain-containing protein|nr:4Fe-4S binding protein [Acidaminococcaceae bacterium]